MTKDEALDLALEALERAERDGGWSIATTKTITAIKQALAAPVQPVQELTIAACIIGSDAAGKKIDGYEAAKVYAAMQKAMGTPPAQPEPVQPLAWAEYNFKEGKFTGLTTDDINSVDSVGTWCQWVPQLQALAAQPAVPDAFGTREGEHPQYIEGWNDCRAEMLRSKP